MISKLIPCFIIRRDGFGIDKFPLTFWESECMIKYMTIDVFSRIIIRGQTGVVIPGIKVSRKDGRIRRVRQRAELNFLCHLPLFAGT